MAETKKTTKTETASHKAPSTTRLIESFKKETGKFDNKPPSR